MGIQQDHITPTGETKSYHRIGGSFEKGSPLFVTINSYPDKASRDSGSCPWMEPVVIPWEEWCDIYDAIAPMLYEKLKAHGYDGEDVEETAADAVAQVTTEAIDKTDSD